MFGVMNTNPGNPNNLLRYEWSLVEFHSIILDWASVSPVESIRWVA
jgi:hypothetical protein